MRACERLDANPKRKITLSRRDRESAKDSNRSDHGDAMPLHNNGGIDVPARHRCGGLFASRATGAKSLIARQRERRLDHGQRSCHAAPEGNCASRTHISREATLAFQIKFFAFAPAKLANRTQCFCHIFNTSTKLHAALFRRPTTIMRNWRDIRHRADF